MPQNTKYQLHLKGFVGGYDFDADYVDYILARNEGKEVNVLIDSLGGQSNTALSIFSAFRRHGNVNVHFVGMNASAATIASLGAKHISMDASAMYLVHKCSIEFLEWGNLNADDLSTLITNIERQKKDLDKLDANIAQMYATRCKKESAELLALMKEGGWLNADEAKEWGFVDEITDYDNTTTPVLTDSTVRAMAYAGIPIPDIPKAEQSAINRFFSALAALFRHSTTTPYRNTMQKEYKNIAGILQLDTLDNNTLTDEQLGSIETAINDDRQTIKALNGRITTLENEKAALETEKAKLEAEKISMETAKAELEAERTSMETEKQSLITAKAALEADKATLEKELAELKKQPAESSAQVVNDQHRATTTKNEVDRYFETRANARSLFDLVP